MCMRPPEKGNLKTGFKKGDFLFPARICGWKSWGQVYQSIDAFRPIIREIFRRHSLAYEEPKHLTPGTNAVFRVGKQIVKIYAPAESGLVPTWAEAAGMKLAETAGIQCEDFARKMFAAGSSLRGRTPEEIFYQDFKTFDIGDHKLGIGQVTSMSQGELGEIKSRMGPFLEKACREHGLDMILFMLTNIIEESTEMLCYGQDCAELVESAFPPAKVADNAAVVPGVVSRKKQVVPALMWAISRSSEV